ncbi:MAG: dockerin type I repeat-containing protein [Oscillospiraceae bacterium]|nr:dockerin type I repeat-containing protein [Oscillospiraceae bacterium]
MKKKIVAVLSAAIMAVTAAASLPCLPAAVDDKENELFPSILLNQCLPRCVFAAAAVTESPDTYTLCPVKESVDEFYSMLNMMPDLDRALLLDEENCWCLRTAADRVPSLEEQWMWLYKDSETGAAHLAAEDKVVQLTGNAGGLGLTSAALGDLNQDGAYEVYFTFSWEPDIYCAQAGYYDTKTAEIHYFGDFCCCDTELIFAVEDGDLTVCKAELTDYADKVHFGLVSKDPVSKILFDESKIRMKPLSDDLIQLEQPLIPVSPQLPAWVPKSAEEAEVFMKEHSTPFVQDGMVCALIYISGADSFGGNRFTVSEKSDVRTPVSYKTYDDNYHGKYIAACYEMPKASYLEFYDNGDRNAQHYQYVSDENGEISKVVPGDVNLDGNVSIADLFMLQRWLLADADKLVCWQNADLSDDCKLNAIDMCLMKKLLLAQ